MKSYYESADASQGADPFGVSAITRAISLSRAASRDILFSVTMRLYCCSGIQYLAPLQFALQLFKGFPQPRQETRIIMNLLLEWPIDTRRLVSSPSVAVVLSSSPVARPPF